ncbi:MAG: MFS transporter [Spirochaetales bacterium]|nr:MFS transporter [Candidatus Physcosoma equi]
MSEAKRNEGNLMEKVAILSLSLILVSTYSVSCIVPKLLEHFSDKPRSAVEFLVSVPSFGIAFMIFLNIWLTKLLAERTSIIIGSVMIILSSFITIVSNNYVVFLLARFLLGLGIGMINARAITTVQMRYEGKELASLLGIRGSMEVLGNMVLTFLAGKLMVLGWHASFGVYLAVLVALGLYLVFVPATEKAVKNETKAKARNGNPSLLKLLFVFGAGFVFINTNVSTTMRMASLMMVRGLGAEAEASVVLSFMLLMGVCAGILFERLFSVLKRRTLSFGLLLMGLGLLRIGRAENLVLLYLGAALSGYANGMLATTVFHEIALDFPPEEVGTVTYAALLGCNLGGAFSPLVLSFLGLFSEGLSFSYGFYGILSLVLAVLLCGMKKAKRS